MVDPEAGYSFVLRDIGRDKVTEHVTCWSPGALLIAVKRHLVSNNVWISPDGIVFAGFRSVGRLEPANDLARATFRRWTTVEAD